MCCKWLAEAVGAGPQPGPQKLEEEGGFPGGPRGLPGWVKVIREPRTGRSIPCSQEWSGKAPTGKGLRPVGTWSSCWVFSLVPGKPGPHCVMHVTSWPGPLGLQPSSTSCQATAPQTFPAPLSRLRPLHWRSQADVGFAISLPKLRLRTRPHPNSLQVTECPLS